MRVANKLAIVTGVLALCVFVGGQLWYARYDWIAVSKPISLKTGYEQRITFVSQKSVAHELELDTERSLEFREQNCRLGIGRAQPEVCQDFPQSLIIRWSIFENAVQIVSGTSADAVGGSWGPTIGKILARFETAAESEYTIHLIVESGDEILNTTTPRIRVSLDSFEQKGAYVVASLAVYLSYALAVLAVLVWLVGLGLRRWAARNADAAPPYHPSTDR